MFLIRQCTSKKGTLFPALLYVEDGKLPVHVTLDPQTMSRITGLSIRDIYLLDDDYIIQT